VVAGFVVFEIGTRENLDDVQDDQVQAFFVLSIFTTPPPPSPPTYNYLHVSDTTCLDVPVA